MVIEAPQHNKPTKYQHHTIKPSLNPSQTSLIPKSSQSPSKQSIPTKRITHAIMSRPITHIDTKILEQIQKPILSSCIRRVGWAPAARKDFAEVVEERVVVAARVPAGWQPVGLANAVECCA